MTERDPHGTPPNEPGAKLDAGKTRAGLVLGGFARALLEVSAVGTFGAEKYTPHGWVSVPDGIERYTDAMHRHLLAEATGERLDTDSGLVHAAHAAWCALARLDLMLRAGQEQPGAVPYFGPDRRKAAEPAATVNDPLTFADADGWIKWEGGECPVPYGTRIDVKYRGGGRAVGIGALIPKLLGNTATHWGHINCSSDIVAYRLSKEASHG